MSVDDQILSSDIDGTTQMNNASSTYPYHTSVCGSMLYTSPTNVPSEIFALVRHAEFDAFRRSFDLYYNDIIKMRNDHGQTVLHLLVIHAFQYVWVRLLMMRGTDMCAQDLDGYTPAHYAAERDDVEMLKALTMRFQSQARPIPEDRIDAIYNQGIKALSMKNNQGLTVFMVACRHGSLKCLNYLISININDSNVEDKYGDTCLQYAVARRHELIVEKLINTCNANVNGGKPERPSALDILKYNRDQTPNEARKDDQIEKSLKAKNARNRCVIRRVTGKRKETMDTDATLISNLACITLDLTNNGQIETARSHARMATRLLADGDLAGAKESYKQALQYAPENTIDWATYAFNLATVHITHGERQLAHELLEKALEIRRQLEHESRQIEEIQKVINTLQIQST